MNHPFVSNYFKRKMPLAVKFTFETLLQCTGDNAVQNFSFGDVFVQHIARITIADFDIFTARWQMDIQWHHLEAALKILLLSEDSAHLHENKRRGNTKYG